MVLWTVIWHWWHSYVPLSNVQIVIYLASLPGANKGDVGCLQLGYACLQVLERLVDFEVVESRDCWKFICWLLHQPRATVWLVGPCSAMQWELGAWKRWARVSQHERKRRHTGRQRRPKHETLHSRPNCRVNDARLPVKRSGGEFRQLIKCAAAGQNTPRIYQGHELHP